MMSAWMKDLSAATKLNADGKPIRYLVRYKDCECPAIVEWKVYSADESGSISDVSYWGFSDELLEDTIGDLAQVLKHSGGLTLADVEWIVIPE